MLPNNLSVFYTVQASTEMNGDHLPSLTKQTGPKKSISASLARVNFSMDNRGPNNYYERLTRSYTNPEMVTHQIAQSYTAKSYDDPGQSVLRQGRLGAPWRHVKQCTGNLGNHICFIDGIVKQNDMASNPPYGNEAPGGSGGKFTYYSYGPKSSIPRNTPRISSNVRSNKFNQHAKNGFRYWYQEKPGVSSFSRYSVGMAGNPYGIPGTSLPAMKGQH